METAGDRSFDPGWLVRFGPTVNHEASEVAYLGTLSRTGRCVDRDPITSCAANAKEIHALATAISVGGRGLCCGCAVGWFGLVAAGVCGRHDRDSRLRGFGVCVEYVVGVG